MDHRFTRNEFQDIEVHNSISSRNFIELQYVEHVQNIEVQQEINKIDKNNQNSEVQLKLTNN